MGVFYETIPQSQFKWILAQKMFWVASAPLAGSGHVNISPKGGDYFGVLDEKTFWYMDLTGSGSETIAHLYEKGNGRITIMFNAFEGAPRILRLFGKGRVLESSTAQFEEFVKKHDVKTIPGTRSIVLVDVHQVGTSCGFSVPFYEFKEHRNVLKEVLAKKDAKFKEGNEKEGLPRYWALNNSWSVDGLPALHTARELMVRDKVQPVKKMVGPVVSTHYQTNNRYGIEHLVLVALVTAVVTALATRFGLDAARAVVIRFPAGMGNLLHSSS